MKSLVIGAFVIIGLVLIGSAYVYFHKTQPVAVPDLQNSPAPVVTTTPSPTNSVTFCTPAQLDGQIAPDAGAGNIFGEITIKNISSTQCQIIGNNNLSANFDSTIKNIAVALQGQPAHSTFNLAAGQIIYSQLHYANGPQCSGVPKQIAVTFSYKTSTTDSIGFKTPEGNRMIVPSCTSQTELTEIQLWPFSATPITP